MPRHLGLFGGTFDPIHLGHIRMAEAFATELHLDQVIFIPAGDPYHKEFTSQTSAHHRINMVQLAIEDHTLFTSSDCDIKRKGQTHTVDTLAYFKQNQPAESALWWLMGSDSLLQLHTWYEFKKIFELTNLAIAIRDDFNLEALDPKVLDLCQQALAKEIDDETNGKMRFLNLPPLAISSRQIRSLVQTNQDLTPYLDAKVVQYIQLHHLY